MGRRMKWSAIALFGIALVAAAGCGLDASTEEAEPATAAESESSAASELESEAEPPPTTSATTQPPSTEPPPPDYEAIYRRLHDDAIAFIMDPLGQPSDAIDCDRNPGCITVTNQALDGQFWQGIGPDNLTITSVEVLDEVGPGLIHLKVAAEAEEVIRLVGPDEEVVDQFTLPTGAVKRVSLLDRDGEWILSSPMDGRSWTRQAFEPRESFSMVDPLDDPMTPTGEEGVTADGVAWRTLVTEDRFCIEATKLPIGRMTRCLSAPQFSDLDTSINFTMAFYGDDADINYLVLWFGLKADEGIINFEDGGVQTDELFAVDTSAVFRDVDLTIGVSMIDQRPVSIAGRGPETESDTIEFDWPVPNS